jgi:hypothetical protein
MFSIGKNYRNIILVSQTFAVPEYSKLSRIKKKKECHFRVVHNTLPQALYTTTARHSRKGSVPWLLP